MHINNVYNLKRRILLTQDYIKKEYIYIYIYIYK